MKNNATENAIISAYLAAKAAQAAAEKVARDAKKKAEKAAADIIRLAGQAGAIDTDMFTVSVTTETRIILDSDKLYTDFPGIKDLDQYGKESTRTVITALTRG